MMTKVAQKGDTGEIGSLLVHHCLVWLICLMKGQKSLYGEQLLMTRFPVPPPLTL